jgi:hypothetical protein
LELAFGTIVFSDNKMEFIPNDEISGIQEFSVQVADEEGKLSNIATLSIEIVDQEDAPEIILDDFDLVEEETKTFNVQEIVKDIDTNLGDLELSVESLDGKTQVSFDSDGQLSIV